jgi:hypothetical protein
VASQSRWLPKALRLPFGQGQPQLALASKQNVGKPIDLRH